MSESKYDVFFLVSSGIGNAIETLYAVEYCLENNVKVGIYLNEISKSFTEYIRDCYGSDVVAVSLDNIHTTNFIQSFTYMDKCAVKYDHYFYIMPTYASTLYQSETEQFLSIVKSLYPSNFLSATLKYLREDYSDKVKAVNPEKKHILYTGCSSVSPVKRWPYFRQLVEKLGSQNVIIIGGQDDLNYKYSYYYPKWMTLLFKPVLTRRLHFFHLMKKIGLLKKHAHLNGIEKETYSYFNVFNWPELVALLKRAGSFVGNDGGITHLAAAVGTKGVAIFGPSSVNKNRPLNPSMAPVSKSYSCQPCQFNVGGTIMTNYSILCPHQLRCLYSIKADEIAERISANTGINND